MATSFPQPPAVAESAPILMYGLAGLCPLRMIRDLRPVSRRRIGVHHEAPRVGLTIDARLEARGLRLEPVAQAGIAGSGGHPGEAARKPRLAPVQGTRRLRQAIFIAVALGRHTLLAADALGLAFRRRRRDGRHESNERADYQRAPERDGGM